MWSQCSESVKYRVRDRRQGYELGVLNISVQNYPLRVVLEILVKCSAIITNSFNCLIYSVNNYCYLVNPEPICYKLLLIRVPAAVTSCLIFFTNPEGMQANT